MKGTLDTDNCHCRTCLDAPDLAVEFDREISYPCEYIIFILVMYLPIIMNLSPIYCIYNSLFLGTTDDPCPACLKRHISKINTGMFE